MVALQSCGTDQCHHPNTISAVICDLPRLTPTCERIIEREHRDIKMAVPSPHSGAVLVSLSNRLPAIVDKLDNDPAQFQSLVAAYQEVRSVREIPQLFPLLALHPLVQQLTKAHQSSHWVAVLSSVIYRHDLDSKFADVADARVLDERVKDSMRRKSATVAARLSRAKHTGCETLLAVAVCQRLRGMATDRSGKVVFSMPSDVARSLFPLLPMQVGPSKEKHHTHVGPFS